MCRSCVQKKILRCQYLATKSTNAAAADMSIDKIFGKTVKAVFEFSPAFGISCITSSSKWYYTCEKCPSTHPMAWILCLADFGLPWRSLRPVRGKQQNFTQL